MELSANWHPSAPTGNADARRRQLLEQTWRLHVAFKDEQWVWRGHWCGNWGLRAGIVTRVVDPAARVPTLLQLLDAARSARLASHDGCDLPDLALMARLQHQGAATALLDVTTDPTVALFMACTEPPDGPYSCCADHAGDATTPDGVLVAVRRPERSLEAFDSRAITDILDSLDGIAYYHPPPIDSRLRIQRGAFLLYGVDDVEEPDLEVTPGNHLKDRLRRRRAAPRAVKDVCVFRVQGNLKSSIAELLGTRAGLSRDVVYPTAFDRPHLQQFAQNHGRSSLVPSAAAP